jgi:FlaA1/EpsC-like NDP-sugar epimerase
MSSFFQRIRGKPQAPASPLTADGLLASDLLVDQPDAARWIEGWAANGCHGFDSPVRGYRPPLPVAPDGERHRARARSRVTTGSRVGLPSGSRGAKMQGPHATILVTGAGGSIGSALTEALANTHCGFLILLDHSEQNLHDIHMRLTAAGRADHAAILGDVLDGPLLAELCERYRPATLYHAAAFKHVPLMESNPIAVIRNNAIGTWELAKAAIACKAERLLVISTDKAVNPRSIMGASKRLAELVVLSMGNAKTKINAVRLGNVLGSQGSVRALFQRQIAQGGPVTVTHSEARRFFMTLQETVDSIIAAAALDESGAIFLPKMSEPVKVLDLAKRMIDEEGLHTPRDIEILFTGLRPGDKLEEQLLSEKEVTAPTSDARLRRVTGPRVDATLLDASLARLAASVRERKLASLLGELGELIPEYTPSETLLRLMAPAFA